MKATFVHFWWVESEFIIKNQFHNWTSELGCIWHFFWKIGLFLPLFKHFSSGSTRCCYSVYFLFSRAASTEVLEKGQKEPNFSKKNAKCTLSLMSNYEINFWLWIQILHIKNEWILPSLSLALFFCSFILSFGHCEGSPQWSRDANKLRYP